MQSNSCPICRASPVPRHDEPEMHSMRDETGHVQLTLADRLVVWLLCAALGLFLLFLIFYAICARYWIYGVDMTPMLMIFTVLFIFYAACLWIGGVSSH